jgi:hypothetical protein
MVEDISIKVEGNEKKEEVNITYYIKQLGNVQLMIPSYLVLYKDLTFPAYGITFFPDKHYNGELKFYFDRAAGWKTFIILADKDVELSVDLDGWVKLNADDEELPSYSIRYVKVAKVVTEDKKGFLITTRLDKIEVEEYSKKDHQIKKYVLR